MDKTNIGKTLYTEPKLLPSLEVMFSGVNSKAHGKCKRPKMEVIYPCYICSKLFKLRISLWLHLGNVHNNSITFNFSETFENTPRSKEESRKSLDLNTFDHLPEEVFGSNGYDSDQNLNCSMDSVVGLNFADYYGKKEQTSTTNPKFGSILADSQSVSNHNLVPYNYDSNSDINSSTSTVVELNLADICDKKEQTNAEKHRFESILTEFLSVKNDIRNQFINDPHYFKDGLQSFNSSLEKHLSSNESLFLACHSFNNDI